VDQESDFTAESIPFRLGTNQVLELDTIILKDEIPPRIASPWNRDTINIADTLRFIVEDLGGDIPTSKIHIFYENDYLYDFKLSNDTLYVPFTKEAAVQSWTYKPITVVAFDASYNRNKKTFYLRPNSTLPEVFSE
jgi:hypothetical protein